MNTVDLSADERLFDEMVSYRKNVTGVDNTVCFATRYDAAQLAHQDGNLAFRLCAGGGFGGLGGGAGNIARWAAR
jgi:hypothetical protein